MRLTIKLNLNTLVATSFTNQFYLTFNNITNLENWHDSDEQPYVDMLEFQQSSTYKVMYVFLNGSTNPDYDERDGFIEDLSVESTYIKFTCDISNSSIDTVMDFINKGIIEINQDGKTVLFAYRLNDEKDKVRKNLTFVSAFEGTFKAPLGIKNIELDVVDYDIENSYNYIYIPKLKRYYYVVNIILTTKDYTRLQLQEDVLMSHKELIMLQSAFVTRYEGSTEKLLVDIRRPMRDVQDVEYLSLLDTAVASSKVNCTLNFNLASNIPMYLVSTITSKVHPARTQITAPSSGLPNLNNTFTRADWVTLLDQDQISTFYGDLFRDEPMASFVNSVVLLPFNPNDSYTTDTSILYVDDKIMCGSGFYKIEDIPSGDHEIAVKRVTVGATPYFIIKDFTITNLDASFDDYEPYTNYELYIPFVGWVQVQYNQIVNNRILIYYTIDNTTGNGTAYIYDFTNQRLIWSSNCQVGIKMNLVTSNALEIEKQKESAQLNLIMGMISSAVSIGIGAVSENPIAIAGGVMAGSKAVASFVNSNRMLFKRGQTTFGTGQGSFHAPNGVILRITYNYLLPIDLDTYKHLNGLPYNNYVTSLNTLTTGSYIEVGDIHFDAKGYNIYSSEIDEIVALLKNGVII